MADMTIMTYVEAGVFVAISGKTSGSLICEGTYHLEQEFQDVVQSVKASTCIVLTNSSDLIYEVVTIPPVADRLMPTLIKTELKRRYLDLHDFSFSYQVVADVPVDGRIVRKVACCLLLPDTAHTLLDTFITHQKAVAGLASVPVVLSTLVQKLQKEELEAQLCVYDEGSRKTLFLMEHGAVIFVRHVPSSGFGLNPDDLNNISMTVDYCFQTLRVRPARTLALNIQNCPDHIEEFALQGGLHEGAINHNACLPAYAIADAELPSHLNLIPPTYLSEIMQQKALKTVALLFLVVATFGSLAVCGLLFKNVQLKAEFRSVQTPQTTLYSELNRYQSDHQNFMSLEKQVLALNRIHVKPALAELYASIEPPSGSVLMITQALAQQEDTRLSLKITGTFTSETFASAQKEVERYAHELAAHVHMNLSEYKIDPSSASFSISMDQVL